MKRRCLEDLRKEYVGQSINWLTILSVDPNPKGGHAVCTCKCKCGKVCIKELKKVVTNHTKSCGCYNSSKEKGIKHSRYFKEHPESVDSVRLNIKKWSNDNPDKVAEISKNISKWYTDNPSLVEKRCENYSKWYNDDMTLMNNNYPSPRCNYSGDFIESYYNVKNYTVYTCGYTHI